MKKREKKICFLTHSVKLAYASCGGGMSGS